MADLTPSRRTPLHPGVDARSWLGFEQKIAARRFEALIANAREAIASANAVLAETALDEAREIRADAPELAQLDAELRQLRETQDGRVWRRAGGALMWLGAGVFLFIALEQLRVLPQNLPLVEPPPLLTAVPTARGADLLAEFADVVADADANTDAESEPEPEPAVLRVDTGAPAAAPARREPPPARRVPTRNAGVTEEAPAPTPAPAVEHEVPLQLSTAALRPALTPAAPAVAMSTPPRSTPASVPGPVPAVLTNRSAEDELRVADVLRRYARAYGTLDVNAAREVWPNVDQRALARAFESLASQTVSFDDCQIAVHGTTANASCRGQASYVGKVGRGAPRTEPRTWRFELRRDGESWKIANAEARRTSG